MGCSHSKSKEIQTSDSPSSSASSSPHPIDNISQFNTLEFYINDDESHNNRGSDKRNNNLPLTPASDAYTLSKEDYYSLYKFESNIYKSFQLKRLNYYNQIQTESILKGNYELKEVSKTPTEALLLFKILMSHYLFSFFNTDYMSEIVSCFNYMDVKKNEKIVSKHTKNKKFFIVFSGLFYKSKDFITNPNSLNISKLLPNRLYNTGSYFNDYSLIYDTSSDYDMICLKEGRLFYIDSISYHYISSQCSKMNKLEIYSILSKIQLFSENYRVNTEIQTTKLTNSIQPSTPKDKSSQLKVKDKYQPTPEELDLVLNELSKWLEIFPYAAGDLISKSGTPAAAFYIIKEGTVSVIPKSRKLDNIYPHQSLINSCSGSYFSNGIMFSEQVLRAGNYFGERSLMSGDMRDSDYIAISHVKLLVLDKYFFDIFFNNSSILNGTKNEANEKYVNLPSHLYIWLHNQLQFHLGLKLLNSLKWLDFPLIPIYNKKIIQKDAKLKVYNRGDVILKVTSLSDLGKLFYILIRGKAQVTLTTKFIQSNPSVQPTTANITANSLNSNPNISLKSKYSSIMRSSNLLNLHKNFGGSTNNTSNSTTNFPSTASSFSSSFKVEESGSKDPLHANVAINTLKQQPQTNLVLGVLEPGQYLGHQMFLSPSIFDNKNIEVLIEISVITDTCVCFQFEQTVYNNIFSQIVDIKLAYPTSIQTSKPSQSPLPTVINSPQKNTSNLLSTSQLKPQSGNLSTPKSLPDSGPKKSTFMKSSSSPDLSLLV